MSKNLPACSTLPQPPAPPRANDFPVVRIKLSQKLLVIFEVPAAVIFKITAIWVMMPYGLIDTDAMYVFLCLD